MAASQRYDSHKIAQPPWREPTATRIRCSLGAAPPTITHPQAWAASGAGSTGQKRKPLGPLNPVLNVQMSFSGCRSSSNAKSRPLPHPRTLAPPHPALPRRLHRAGKVAYCSGLLCAGVYNQPTHSFMHTTWEFSVEFSCWQ